MHFLNSFLHNIRRVQGSGGSAQIFHDDSDIGDRPVFVDPTNHDFHEAEDSPTIDAGLDDGAYGNKDVAGLPRSMGESVDIGAFEFPMAPDLSDVHVSHRAKHSVSVSATVDTDGLSATAQLVAGHNGSTISAKPTSLADRSGSKVMSLDVSQLKRHTRYRLTVSVTDDGGTAAQSIHAKTR